MKLGHLARFKAYQQSIRPVTLSHGHACRKNFILASLSSSPSPSFPSGHAWLQYAKALLAKQALPISLSSAVFVGIVCPNLGVAASRTSWPSYVLVVIFLLSGLQLKPNDALQALRAWRPLALSLVSLLLISPLVFTPALFAAGHLLPLQPSILLGLCVFMASPTALSAGVQLTSLMGGSIALAILIVILSNSLACFTLPILLPIALGGVAIEGGIGIDRVALLSKLVSSCLIPTIVGCLLRISSSTIAGLVDSNKVAVSWISALCLASLPWTQISTTKLNGGLDTLNAVSLVSLLAACFVLRLLLLLFNGLASVLLLRDQRSSSSHLEYVNNLKTLQVVILLSSQRTLPVALTLISSLSSVEASVRGLASLACVIVHMSWIVIDSGIVSYLIGRYGKFT
jgi:sodium/bile acid cotransporter 7